MDSTEIEFDNQLIMNTVVSLTNWNASGGANPIIVRDVITARLFENSKFMYNNSGSYDNYYFKMPEIGNAPINYIDETPTGDTVEESYRSGHNAYYVGSVVGKTMFRYNSTAIGNSYGSTVEQNSHVIYNTNLIEDLYNQSSNVFSSTST